jgi:serine/threonine-protein kinase RsbW
MTDGWPTPELELEFSPKPGFVRMARHTVAALTAMHGFDDQLVDDVKLAVSEASTNAMVSNAQRAAEGEGPAPVVVMATADEEGIEIRVFDRGAAHGPEVSGSPIELSTEDLPFDKALSLPLIRGLVDDLEITHRDGGGSVVRMRLHGRASSGA